MRRSDGWVPLVCGLVAVVALATASGCGADPAPRDAAAPDDACSRYGAALAEHFRICSGFRYEPEIQAAPAGEATCRSLLALDGAQATEAHFERCAAALADAPCTSPGNIPACQSPLGARAVGAPCVSDWQCASLVCDAVDGCGTCLAAPAVGEPCGATMRCEPGAVCAGEGAPCEALVLSAEGEPCGAGCEYGTWCDAGVCRPLPGEGAPCDGLCAAHGLCSPETNTCITFHTAGLGEFCGAGPVLSVCGPGLDCSTGGPGNHCVRATFVAPGEACGGDFIECAVGRCPYESSGPPVCPAVLGEGAACTPDDPTALCDVSAPCIDGTCQRPENVACE